MRFLAYIPYMLAIAVAVKHIAKRIRESLTWIRTHHRFGDVTGIEMAGREFIDGRSQLIFCYTLSRNGSFDSVPVHVPLISFSIMPPVTRSRVLDAINGEIEYLKICTGRIGDSWSDGTYTLRFDDVYLAGGYTSASMVVCAFGTRIDIREVLLRAHAQYDGMDWIVREFKYVLNNIGIRGIC